MSFQHAHAGSRFARIEYACVRTLKLLHIAARHGGNAAHALHHVEHQAFGLEQGTHFAGDNHGHVAGLHVGAVGHEHFHLHGGVETVEYLFGYLHACKHTRLLDEES